MNNEENSQRTLTHVCGTLLIDARGAFLNGGSREPGETDNVVGPKTFSEGDKRVPYVSAQSWRRWLRNTLIAETGWNASDIQATDWNEGGKTKKAQGRTNPFTYAEDDLFGFMKTAEGQGKRRRRRGTASTTEDVDDVNAEQEGEPEQIAAIMRASPLATSILASIRRDGWLGRDEGFVHVRSHDPEALERAEWLRTLKATALSDQQAAKRLKEALKKLEESIEGLSPTEALPSLRALGVEFGLERESMPQPHSPLPYTTKFFNTHLEGVFCLDHSRVGVFWNLGDRNEIEPSALRKLQESGDVVLKKDLGGQGQVYQIKDRSVASIRSRRLIQALAVLRGGAKQAAFATDVAPKALILAGLSCGNPIFNRLFKDMPNGPELNLDRLKEIVGDYKDRIATPVFVGIREGYLSNQQAVRKENKSTAAAPAEWTMSPDQVGKLVVCTPVEAANRMASLIP